MFWVTLNKFTMVNTVSTNTPPLLNSSKYEIWELIQTVWEAFLSFWVTSLWWQQTIFTIMAFWYIRSGFSLFTLRLWSAVTFRFKSDRTFKCKKIIERFLLGFPERGSVRQSWTEPRIRTRITRTAVIALVGLARVRFRFHGNSVQNSPEIRGREAGISPSTWRIRLVSARRANDRGAEDDGQTSSQ